jgi:hypothetical protein
MAGERKTHTMNTNTRDETQKKRDHALTIYIDDPSIKETITAAAKKDNRKKSDWFRTYILPAALKLAEDQLAKDAVPRLLPLATPPRQLSHFERLRHEAESALQSEQVR